MVVGTSSLHLLSVKLSGAARAGLAGLGLELGLGIGLRPGLGLGVGLRPGLGLEIGMGFGVGVGLEMMI